MIEVAHEADAHRYVVTVGGEPAGRLDYDRRGDQLVALHTEVDSRFEGQGLGGRLVEALLDDVRRYGQQLVARCPFVASYLRKHPGNESLLAPETPDAG